MSDHRIALLTVCGIAELPDHDMRGVTDVLSILDPDMPEPDAFAAWLASIKDGLTRIRLAKRLDKVQRGLLGDVEPVGEGVCEMREFFGPGWRMYYIERSGVIIVMLGGGDKSTQQADIATAIALSKTIEEMLWMPPCPRAMN